MTAWTAHYIMLWIAFVAFAVKLRWCDSQRDARVCLFSSMLCGSALIAMLVFAGPS